MTLVINTADGIAAYRLLALKGALGLEIKGLKRSRGQRSAYSIIKAEFDLKGNKQKVYDQYVQLLKDGGILV